MTSVVRFIHQSSVRQLQRVYFSVPVATTVFDCFEQSLNAAQERKDSVTISINVWVCF